MEISHVTATTQCITCLAACRSLFSDQFAFTIVQSVALTVNKNRTFCSINNSTASCSVCVYPVPALTIPVNGFVFRKEETRIHSVIHFPSVILKMLFGSLYIYALRVLDL